MLLITILLAFSTIQQAATVLKSCRDLNLNIMDCLDKSPRINLSEWEIQRLLSLSTYLNTCPANPVLRKRSPQKQKCAVIARWLPLVVLSWFTLSKSGIMTPLNQSAIALYLDKYHFDFDIDAAATTLEPVVYQDTHDFSELYSEEPTSKELNPNELDPNETDPEVIEAFRKVDELTGSLSRGRIQ